MIDYAKLRLEVASKHNILVDKDDPVLVTVTLNEHVFQRYVDILVERNTELLVSINAAQQQGMADAKVTAGRVITEGGKYFEEQMRTGLIDATKDLIAQHRKALGAAWKEIENARKTVIAAAVVSCFCAVVSVVVAVNAVT
jgi:CHASE3 domain sensor protein